MIMLEASFTIGLEKGTAHALFTCMYLKRDRFTEVIVLEHWCSGNGAFGFVKCVILCLCPSDLVTWVRDRMMVLSLGEQG